MTGQVYSNPRGKEEGYNTKQKICELKVVTERPTRGEMTQLLWRAVCL
jgi:hypothetical protein